MDSASALRVVQGSVQAARVANADLLRHLPGSTSLPAYYKVKAHLDPAQVGDDQLRAVLGNVCADRGAEAARLADLANVQEVAASVASWRKSQDVYLRGYFSYLLQRPTCCAC